MEMGGFYGREGPLDSWRALVHGPPPEILEQATPASGVSKDHGLSPDTTAPPTVHYRLSQYRILVTELEILDKSKGDTLGKLFTLLQTTWFIVQYLERWVATSRGHSLK